MCDPILGAGCTGADMFASEEAQCLYIFQGRMADSSGNLWIIKNAVCIGQGGGGKKGLGEIVRGGF